MSCPSTSSGLKSSSAVISALPGRLTGLQVQTDGTNAATVTIYDSASAASGLVLAKFSVLGASLAGDAHLPEGGIVANQGIYASISGTGATCIVTYQAG